MITGRDVSKYRLINFFTQDRALIVYFIPYQNVEFFKKIFLGKNTAVRPISVYGDYVYQLRSKRKMSALTSSAWF